MRYNIGLGVGHSYAHGQPSSDLGGRAADGEIMREGDEEFESSLPDSPPAIVLAAGSDSEDSSIDYGMDGCEYDSTDGDDIDNEELLVMDEMYG